MKVYLVGDSGPEHNSLNWIFLDKEKALKQFQEHRISLLEDAKKMLTWAIREDSWSIAMYKQIVERLSNEDPETVENYPHDTPFLREMEITE